MRPLSVKIPRKIARNISGMRICGPGLGAQRRLTVSRVTLGRKNCSVCEGHRRGFSRCKEVCSLCASQRAAFPGRWKWQNDWKNLKSAREPRCVNGSAVFPAKVPAPFEVRDQKSSQSLGTAISTSLCHAHTMRRLSGFATGLRRYAMASRKDSRSKPKLLRGGAHVSSRSVCLAIATR